METKAWQIPELVDFEKKLTNDEDKAALAEEVKKIRGTLYIFCFNFCITRLRKALSENYPQIDIDAHDKIDKTQDGKTIDELLREQEKKKRGAEKIIIKQSLKHKLISSEDEFRLLQIFDKRCKTAHPNDCNKHRLSVCN